MEAQRAAHVSGVQQGGCGCQSSGQRQCTIAQAAVAASLFWAAWGCVCLSACLASLSFLSGWPSDMSAWVSLRPSACLHAGMATTSRTLCGMLTSCTPLTQAWQPSQTWSHTCCSRQHSACCSTRSAGQTGPCCRSGCRNRCSKVRIWCRRLWIGALRVRGISSEARPGVYGYASGAA